MSRRFGWTVAIGVCLVGARVIAQDGELKKGDQVVVRSTTNVGLGKARIATLTNGQRLNVTAVRGTYLGVDVHGAKGWIDIRDVDKVMPLPPDPGIDGASPPDRRANDVANYFRTNGDSGNWFELEGQEPGSRTKAIYFILNPLDAGALQRALGAPDVKIFGAHNYRPVIGDEPEWWEGLEGERWYYGSAMLWVYKGKVLDYAFWKVLGDPPPRVEARKSEPSSDKLAPAPVGDLPPAAAPAPAPAGEPSAAPAP